ncbi:hypothetical protein HELRODRAFT_84034 [Helobdella robusta]|uniref:RRM domain-containing protein n=1 Tax=Helobdella robusta TaxID=6412 RepID=T1G5D7_HELRO|nr:hypothetical protein HELRODRAFT_84034 [Helobdella robusta]ESN99633.1 hypothetical protein HELRODRAFT_84034 [Helobdella robusta]
MATRVLKSYKLFVGNLSWTVSPAELRNYFSKYGQVKQSRIIFSKSGWSRGYGFVTFNRENDFKSVFNQKDHFLGGHMVKLALKF